MLKVGLTGGLASGKSFVGRSLADLGCHLIQADEIGHEVLSPGGAAYDGVVREFGRDILTPDGGIDRRRLASEVFGKPERLVALNRLVHPLVVRREEELLDHYASIDPNGIVIVEAAILIETGSYRRFDRLILVVCDERQQIERAIKRDQVTEDEVRARLSRQMPLAEKRKFSNYVINTSGSKQDTLAEVRTVYDSLRSITS